MAKKAPANDPGDRDLRVGPPKDVAAGVPGVVAGLKAAYAEMGVRRTALTLARVNQKHGFDCPGCAWPESGGHRSPAEFCENGAKAVAEEATLRRVTREFFEQHSLDDLAGKSDYWLGQQGRITRPMVKRPGASHYTPIAWDEAFSLLASVLNKLESPDQAAFYTSGRTSNEAAFLYQLFARAFGTNNLPDCSNMCHESSGSALNATIGIGKGSVSLEDIHRAGLIVVVGQNPGTNHPRMLSALEIAKRNGAKIISVNPLPEAGLIRFKNPQHTGGVVGAGTALSDVYLQIKVGGDLALFQAIGSLLLEHADREFIERHTTGFESYAANVREVDWAKVEHATGLGRAQIEDVARMFAESEATIACWAMGLTQHKDAVATIQEVVNVQLLRGMIGKPGAGLCPVRGHSNVQGDRTMGVWERVPAWGPALGKEFDFPVPAETGHDTVDTIRAMRDGRVKVFVGMGGNFASATPDTELTEAALRSCTLTAHISTKLNRSHVVTGETALILPCLGRTEADPAGFVTVEDSMSCVHASRGRLKPASDLLLSEVAIVSRLGAATLGDHIPWREFEHDYREVRARIARVIPGFENYEERLDGAGFTLPHPPRDSRSFNTPDGRAQFTTSPMTVIDVPEGRLLLQTLRSHDQYNTTIYGLDDRYRGIKGGRRVVFAHTEDLASFGVADGSLVDIVSEWPDGERRAESFRAVAYPTPRGCAAAYFPEANVLVPLDSVATGSNTPTSKAIVIRLEAR
ncbi:FdhF/YdeP family oxidoreductase [Longispora albida]|uniref:FdhF/YdeP family oxidoreductase n=1 Tax=Longispora albida TaxID=203523 RepID=UPI00035FD83E|nr:FdhF/YdeP family oxidoreductase [Longispora albida]